MPLAVVGGAIGHEDRVRVQERRQLWRINSVTDLAEGLAGFV